MMDFLWDNFFKKEGQGLTSVLKKNPLFQSLSSKELKLLSALSHPRSFTSGEFVFQKGKGLGMYIILSGGINILHTEQGRKEPQVISQLKEEDFFGELCLVQKKGSHQVSAQASRQSRLVGFFRPDLLNMMEKHPSTAGKILMNLGEILAERLIKAGEDLSQLDQVKNRFNQI